MPDKDNVKNILQAKPWPEGYFSYGSQIFEISIKIELLNRSTQATVFACINKLSQILTLTLVKDLPIILHTSSVDTIRTADIRKLLRIHKP